MFDLRSALTSAITALNIQYITTKVFDGDSTEAALADIEKNVFTDGAVVVGDWVHESIAWTHGLNRVRNSIELLVCAKSATAQAALATTVNNLQVGLTRLSLNDPYWLTTIVADVSELRKTENARIQYKIMTLEIMAYESATAAEATNHHPSITIVYPTEGLEIPITGGPEIEFAVQTTYTVGDYPVNAGAGRVYIGVVAHGNWESGRQLFIMAENMSDGTANRTWTINEEDIVHGLPSTIYAIIIDSAGNSATDEVTFTFV